MKKVADVRKEFLNFFASKGHEIVESSSLVPFDDPTLLFTNAGMNQFKDVFLGKEKRSYVRAATAQRCVRAGGKHNDLDNVGYTARHHTFFEMLGNFSFGDYFKEDAIKFAWEFLTSENYLNLPKEKLWVTIYTDDEEAFNIWHKQINLSEERIIRIGDNKGAPFASDNFWQMGDTGPCGPCTEIFYDHGEHIWGGLPGTPEEDGDRFIEIWNLVFMQYNRLADGTMELLPKQSVDTGVGLERLSAVLQHVNNNYDIDLFQTIIKKIAEILNVKDMTQQSLKVIADHIRSCAFLIADGIIPSNEGRGYVLRRIIRRAIRHGHMLGAKETFFYKLVPTLIYVMEEAGKVLQDKQQNIEHVLKIEEEQFNKTLDRGLLILNDALSKVKDGTLSGKIAFQLYDTYGFPLDLTADVCREHNIQVDEDTFNREMEIQRKKAKKSNKFSVDYTNLIRTDLTTNYVGRSQSSTAESKVTAIFIGSNQVEEIKEGEEAVVIIDVSPFFAEAGGQIGDTGTMTTLDQNNIFTVKDTQKYGQAYGHIGSITKGCLKVGDLVATEIDLERRNKISLNHSGTHLLHMALRKLIGPHAEQKGSLVADNILRFDFANYQPLTQQEMDDVENYINDYIRACHESTTEITDLDTAIAKGAVALFGDRYEDTKHVRMVTTGPESIELCGGVHVHNTGEIGYFKIIAEYGISTGIRRIEALTGKDAVKYAQNQTHKLEQVNKLIKADNETTIEKIEHLQDRQKKLEKELNDLKEQLAKQEVSNLISSVETINNTKVLIKEVSSQDLKTLRVMIDQLKNNLNSGVIVLASIDNDKPILIAGVTKDLTNKVKANDLIKLIAVDIDGKGGGKPDMATAGGLNIHGAKQALANAEKWLKENL